MDKGQPRLCGVSVDQWEDLACLPFFASSRASVHVGECRDIFNNFSDRPSRNCCSRLLKTGIERMCSLKTIVVTHRAVKKEKDAKTSKIDTSPI